jgi:hypothetical protein
VKSAARPLLKNFKCPVFGTHSMRAGIERLTLIRTFQ